MSDPIERSPKSYGIAVGLCGIFGTLGIHHFYLKDYLHGVADLVLFTATIYFLVNDDLAFFLLALAMDLIHTTTVFYLLIVEKWRDAMAAPYCSPDMRGY